jgi:hypothetical protein
MNLESAASVEKTHVVLRRNGAVQVLVKERKFLENVFPDTRNFAEEEDGEKTSGDTESASNSATTTNIDQHRS